MVAGIDISLDQPDQGTTTHYFHILNSREGRPQRLPLLREFRVYRHRLHRRFWWASITINPPVVAAAKGATEAVSEAANELRRAELTLDERRWRLAEAQDRAKQEAEALAEAEAAIFKARGVPAPLPSQALAAQSTTAALLRQHNQQPAFASSSSDTKRPAPQSLGTYESGAKKRMVGGLPLTLILEDLDNTFQSSALPAQKHTGKKTNQDLLKITEEELLRANVEAAKPPLQQQLDHRSSSSTASRAPL